MYEVGGEHGGNSETFENSDVTLRVCTHEASMDVGRFSQRSPTLLDNLLPEVKKGVNESGYDICFISVPFRTTK